MASKADLTKLYVEVRDRIAARKAEFEAADSADKDILRNIELVLMAKMDTDGEESVRTPFGTAFIGTDDFASVETWDIFRDFIKENDAFDMLEKRCAKTAIRQYIEANNAPPPGIKYGTRRTLSVRRPTKRKPKGEASEVTNPEDNTQQAN